MLTFRRRNHATTTYRYDDLNRRSFMEAPNDTVADVTYSYDNFGDLLSATQPGQALSFGYDIHGRLTNQTSPLGTVNMWVRQDGLVTRLFWPDTQFAAYPGYLNGASPTCFATISMSMPTASVIPNMTASTGSIAGSSACPTILRSGIRPMTPPNASARSTSMRAAARAFTICRASRIILRARSRPAPATTRPSPSTINRPARRATPPNGLNQYSNVNPPGAGSITPQYDELGALTGYDGRSFNYDAIGRLASTSMNGEQTKFEYDPLGRLSSIDPPGAANDRRFLWDRASIIGEYTGLSGTGTLIRRYVHTPSGDLGAPIAVSEGTSMTAASMRYLLTDERGSVVVRTDSAAAGQTINSYGPYGEPGAGNAGLYQYAGQPWIAEAGLYYMRNRWYHAGLGRFTSPDPIGYAGGMNLYAYVGDDPINAWDPLGLVCERELPMLK